MRPNPDVRKFIETPDFIHISAPASTNNPMGDERAVRVRTYFYNRLNFIKLP